MSWSDWLPWRRRRHPLGWPKPSRPIKFTPEHVRRKERERRAAITAALVRTLGRHGLHVQDQGKPDAGQPTGVYPFPFPLTCTSRQGGGTGWVCSPPTHICDRPHGHEGWHACPCRVTRSWPDQYEYIYFKPTGYLRSLQLDVHTFRETGGGHRPDPEEPPTDDHPFGPLTQRAPCPHPFGYHWTHPLNAPDSHRECPICGAGPRPTEGGAG